MNFKALWSVLGRALLSGAALAPHAAHAAYPEKNIQYIIPFVAGGESDKATAAYWNDDDHTEHRILDSEHHHHTFNNHSD